MLNKGVTLRGLEVFAALAASGSVAQAAEVTGLSQPAVSQQLRNLETALGTDLVDHGRRPMRLTPVGRGFLARAETVLSELRLAQSELTVMDLSHLSRLTLGLIDDFDDELTPRLATILADSMTRCQFKLVTAASHEISAAVATRDLHMGVAASAGQVGPGVVEYPLVRDPFILVAPRGAVKQGKDVLTGDLPFLRYAREQLIARQIETHLARQKIMIETRLEIGSHLALMAMVARRIGWAVTTPLGYRRAARFEEEIEAFALPFGSFARTISLYADGDYAEQVPQELARTIRHLVQSQMIDPVTQRLPWLAGDLRILDR